MRHSPTPRQRLRRCSKNFDPHAKRLRHCATKIDLHAGYIWRNIHGFQTVSSSLASKNRKWNEGGFYQICLKFELAMFASFRTNIDSVLGSNFPVISINRCQGAVVSWQWCAVLVEIEARPKVLILGCQGCLSHLKYRFLRVGKVQNAYHYWYYKENLLEFIGFLADIVVI